MVRIGRRRIIITTARSSLCETVLFPWWPIRSFVDGTVFPSAIVLLSVFKLPTLRPLCLLCSSHPICEHLIILLQLQSPNRFQNCLSMDVDILCGPISSGVVYM